VSDIYYDPFDTAIDEDPHSVWRRMREDAPLWFNDKHEFYALTRFDDVEKGLIDWDTYRSGKGSTLELIKAGIEMPAGMVLMEDPPIHDIHRSVMSRVFTPKKMLALEGQVREFCARSLDPLVGSGGFDFIGDLGAQMPMRVIGMLLGIPEQDQESVRDQVDANLRTEAGKPMDSTDGLAAGDMFGEYIDWRVDHPSDDIMTELLNVEFDDADGTRRRLTRDELLTYLAVVAGAGNETTTRLIGWTGKVLADHPDQRREIVEDRSLVGPAIEELLRYEPPAPHVGRYVAKETEIQGQTVPAGSAILFLVGAANRDEDRFEHAEQFDIHRPGSANLTFGFGAHFCLGAALARLEGRVALDELLNRFPAWDVDLSGARIASTSTVRGWETLPIVLP